MTDSKFMRWALGIFLVGGIFYVFPPGSPQPADFFMMLLLGLALVTGRLKWRKMDEPLVLFVFYAFLVSFFWTLWLGDLTLLLSPAYFTYNLLVFVIFSTFLSDPKSAEKLLPFVVAGLALEVAYLTVTSGVGSRAIGTFTNPNQLSYFGICFTSFGMMLAIARQKTALAIVVLVLGWLVVLFGLSKAAIFAMLVLSAFLLLILPNRRGSVIVFGFLGAIALAYLADTQIDAAVSRVETVGTDNDDSLAGRGYDRILNEFQYVFLGAGDGVYKRHDSVWDGEIHSSFGTILFSYGVPGLLLFGFFLYKILRRNQLGFIIFIMPLLVYSLTHNGLRYTPFWICLAACAHLSLQARPKARPAARPSTHSPPRDLPA